MLLLEKYYQNCQACFGCSECECVKVALYLSAKPSKAAWLQEGHLNIININILLDCPQTLGCVLSVGDLRWLCMSNKPSKAAWLLEGHLNIININIVLDCPQTLCCVFSVRALRWLCICPLNPLRLQGGQGPP